jgi:hypothetical protein
MYLWLQCNFAGVESLDGLKDESYAVHAALSLVLFYK